MYPNKFLFSVCESPTYIEARERYTYKTWMGLDSTLIYLVKSNEENPSWAMGFSKDFGYVRLSFDIFSKNNLRFLCLKDLNINKTECADFEARFCCPKSSSTSEYATSEATSLKSTAVKFSTHPSLEISTADTIIDPEATPGMNFPISSTMMNHESAMKTDSLTTESKTSETAISTTESGSTSEAASDAVTSEMESETITTPSATSSYSFKRWSFENNNLTQSKPSSIDDLRIFINFELSLYQIGIKIDKFDK